MPEKMSNDWLREADRMESCMIDAQTRDTGEIVREMGRTNGTNVERPSVDYIILVSRVLHACMGLAGVKSTTRERGEVKGVMARQEMES